MSLYETPALYNQNMADDQQKKLYEFYETVFKPYEIKTLHDSSIGAGGTTIPFAKLGYEVSGSDLSENLLKKAKENFEKEGYQVDLFQADFRALSDALPKTYDCIVSTGNSLPHINNQEVQNFLMSIAPKIKAKGLFYLDMRNWDKILNEKPIFTARHPRVMTSEEHSSLYQIWNWHDDLSVNFVFVHATDRHGKHVGTSILEAPTYYPLKRKDYVHMLEKAGFEPVAFYDMDALWSVSGEDQAKTGNFEEDFPLIDWYGILAQKK